MMRIGRWYAMGEGVIVPGSVSELTHAHNHILSPLGMVGGVLSGGRTVHLPSPVGLGVGFSFPILTGLCLLRISLLLPILQQHHDIWVPNLDPMLL